MATNDCFSNGLIRGLYDERNQVLYGVSISDPTVRFGPTFSVGSSFDDLKRLLTSYSGPPIQSWSPLRGSSEYLAEFHFELGTVKRIDVYDSKARLALMALMGLGGHLGR